MANAFDPMPNDFSEVEHQLQETLNRLKQAKGAAQRRTLLLHLRLLAMEGERLLLEDVGLVNHSSPKV